MLFTCAWWTRPTAACGAPCCLPTPSTPYVSVDLHHLILATREMNATPRLLRLPFLSPSRVCCSTAATRPPALPRRPPRVSRPQCSGTYSSTTLRARPRGRACWSRPAFWDTHDEIRCPHGSLVASWSPTCYLFFILFISRYEERWKPTGSARDVCMVARSKSHVHYMPLVPSCDVRLRMVRKHCCLLNTRRNCRSCLCSWSMRSVGNLTGLREMNNVPSRSVVSV